MYFLNPTSQRLGADPVTSANMSHAGRGATKRRASPPATIGALLSLVLLGGCAAPAGVLLPDLSDWERRQAVLGQLDEFDFRGRIAVSAGEDGFNGKLRWSQDENAFRATVSGPLGVGTVQIEGDDERVEMTDKDGVKTVLEDVEPELYYRYGWTIPVESLRYWALGIPDPRLPATTEFGDSGELVRLEQRGWRVEVGRYRDVGGGQPMPQRLDAANADTTVRLIIDRWVFHDTIAVSE